MEIKENDYKLSDLIESCCDIFDNDYDWGEDGDNYDKEDIIHEVADNNVPIYYGEICLYGFFNHELIQDIPECGIDDQPPYKTIQINIYERICEGLYEHLQELEEKEE
tara:strand:+ start:3456 stop:3779 length:324 start_codon:yes stop_codon:yes gene_type:complete